MSLLRNWDVTLPERKLEWQTVDKLLRAHCDNYAFQLEKGAETGYRHFQIRLKLHKRDSLKNTAKLFEGMGAHLSPTSTANTTNLFYVTKTETRIEGPWTEKDPVPEPPMESDYVDLIKAQGLLPWQQSVVHLFEDHIEHRDTRTVHVIYDPVGCTGKSALTHWLLYKKLATIVPPLRLPEDLPAFCLHCRATGYAIDMPRSLPKDHLAGMWAGIEAVKSGTFHDKRYSGQIRIGRCPAIVVFTNKLPCFNHLSKDRWCIWTIWRGHLRIYNYPVE